MKQARASHAEWEALVDWFNAREAAGEPVPEWRRVVFGYDVLFTNAGDPAKDYLDWKPGTSPAEITALQKDKARLDSGSIRLVHRDEFGDLMPTVHSGVDLRAAIDAAAQK